MHSNQTVSQMVEEVLMRQARFRAAQSGECLEGAMKEVLQSEAGRQLRDLGNGEYCDKKAAEWQKDLIVERTQQLLAHFTQPVVSGTSEVPQSPVAERNYSWLESYLERLKGKEARQEYYESWEQELEDLKQQAGRTDELITVVY